MVKTSVIETAEKQQTKKLRQKQEKREAQQTLKVEQAKKGVKKVGRKLAKTQLKLKDAQNYLQRMEDKLSTLRTASQQKQEEAQVNPTDQNTEQLAIESHSGVNGLHTHNATLAKESDEPIFEHQNMDIPPAEGRTDLVLEPVEHQPETTSAIMPVDESSNTEYQPETEVQQPSASESII